MLPLRAPGHVTHARGHVTHALGHVTHALGHVTETRGHVTSRTALDHVDSTSQARYVPAQVPHISPAPVTSHYPFVTTEANSPDHPETSKLSLITLHPSPFTLHPSPFTLNTSPSTLNPNPQDLAAAQRLPRTLRCLRCLLIHRPRRAVLLDRGEELPERVERIALLCLCCTRSEPHQLL
eukprot:1763516-Rhodomonas_salina.1